jgi:hypothetical protein
MFEAFSAGYYLGRLYVEPHDSDTPVLHSEHHEAVNRELYASGEGVERVDLPLVMKLETTHFPVLGDEDVPAGTLGLPPEYLDDLERCEPPSLCEVFLAKADRAAQLLEVSGWEPNGEAVT